MRAALLQCPGDPFILSYWLRNYERVWRDEVDELRIFVNGQGDGPILDACRRMSESAGALFSSQSGRLVHGQATEVLLHATQADEVLLIEDDAFVRLPGAVARAFKVARDGHVVGSPRGGMSPEVERAALERWGSPAPEGLDGSSGYGLWPCFMFGPIEVMRPVAHGISSLTWPAGSVIPGVEFTCPDTMTTDTATLAAFILRDAEARGELEIIHQGQWKELWMKDLAEMQNRAEYDPPWFHSGGLSNELFFAGGQALGARPGLQDTNEGLDWAHRVWWWRRCLDTYPDGDLEDVKEIYRRNLNRAVRLMGIAEMVESWNGKLEPWITWDDGA